MKCKKHALYRRKMSLLLGFGRKEQPKAIESLLNQTLLRRNMSLILGSGWAFAQGVPLKFCPYRQICHSSWGGVGFCPGSSFQVLSFWVTLPPPMLLLSKVTCRKGKTRKKKPQTTNGAFRMSYKMHLIEERCPCLGVRVGFGPVTSCLSFGLVCDLPHQVMMAKGWPQDFLEAKDVEVSQPGRKKPKEMVLDTHVKIRDFRTNLFFIGVRVGPGPGNSKFFLALYVSLPHQVVVVPPKVVKWARLGRDVPDNKIVFILINCFCFPKTEETYHLNCLEVRVGFGPGTSLSSLLVAGGHGSMGVAQGKGSSSKGCEMGKIGKGRNYPRQQNSFLMYKLF